MGEFRFFAGGNTAGGFFSRFDQILPERRQKRMYYIKGGPGLGKSSLMKRVAAALEEAGQEVEYFHCSSDPESLDGISAPALGVGMMDGTAPHVQDPVIPGARDTLLSLGDFLEGKALVPKLGEIRALMGEISERFARCYQYLGAAAKIRQAACRGREEPGPVAALVQELTQQYLPLRGGRGGLRTLFGAAFTPKGHVNLLGAWTLDTTVALECPFGQSADALLRALGEAALGRGLEVVALLDPLEPQRWQHVLLPDHSLLFTAGERPLGREPAQTIPPERYMTLGEASDRERSFDRNAYELMVQRAVEQLKAAKGLHDELEGFYVPQMDFLKWEELLARVKGEVGV